MYVGPRCGPTFRRSALAAMTRPTPGTRPAENDGAAVGMMLRRWRWCGLGVGPWRESVVAEPMVLVVTDRDSVGAALVGGLICRAFCQVGHGWAGRLAGCRQPALFPCWLVFPGGGVFSDARSSLICAGWLPQDGLLDWNGHHCLQKANVASSGWLFIGLAWIPFLARVSDSTCRQGHR
jgi:hypothetical protein